MRCSTPTPVHIGGSRLAVRRQHGQWLLSSIARAGGVTASPVEPAAQRHGLRCQDCVHDTARLDLTYCFSLTRHTTICGLKLAGVQTASPGCASPFLRQTFTLPVCTLFARASERRAQPAEPLTPGRGVLLCTRMPFGSSSAVTCDMGLQLEGLSKGHGHAARSPIPNSSFHSYVTFGHGGLLRNASKLRTINLTTFHLYLPPLRSARAHRLPPPRLVRRRRRTRRPASAACTAAG